MNSCFKPQSGDIKSERIINELDSIDTSNSVIQSNTTTLVSSNANIETNTTTLVTSNANIQTAVETLVEQGEDVVRNYASNQMIAELIPVLQNGFTLDTINSQIWFQQIVGGSTSVLNEILTMATDGNANDTVFVRSNRNVVYPQGLSVICRTTAKFTAPFFQGWAFVGAGSGKSDALIGYSFGQFVARIASNGRNDYYTVQILTNPSGLENITITIGTDVITGQVNASTSLDYSAYQLSIMSPLINGILYTNHVDGDTMTIVGIIGIPKGPITPTFVSDGTMTATITRIQDATAPVNTDIPSTSWNGEADFISTFNPAEFNEYEIELSQFGNINFKAYDCNEGRFRLLHSYMNCGVHNLTTSFFFLERFNLNLRSFIPGGGFPEPYSFESSAGALYTSGKINTIRPQYSADISKTILANTETNLIYLTRLRVKNGVLSDNEQRLIQLSASTDGNKSVLFRFYKNPTSVGNNTQADFPNTNLLNPDSTILFDTFSTTHTGGNQVFSITLPKVGSELFTFGEEQFTLQTNDTLLITAFSPNVNEVTLSIGLDEKV